MTSLMRRASASIRGSVSGHKELAQLVASSKNVKSSAKSASTNAQEWASLLAKWSEKEQNTAFQMVSLNLHELEKVAAAAAAGYLQALKAQRKLIERIYSMERVNDVVEKDLARCQRNVKQAEKEQARASRRGGCSAAETKLKQAQSLLETLASEAEKSRRELAEFKARVLREALLLETSARVHLHEVGLEVARARATIVRMLPSSAPHEWTVPIGPQDFERAQSLVVSAKDTVAALQQRFEEGPAVGRGAGAPPAYSELSQQGLYANLGPPADSSSDEDEPTYAVPMRRT